MKLPTFSIIVPIYNTSAYLEQCLQSIKEQTYPHYEVKFAIHFRMHAIVSRFCIRRTED